MNETHQGLIIFDVCKSKNENEVEDNVVLLDPLKNCHKFSIKYYLFVGILCWSVLSTRK